MIIKVNGISAFLWNPGRWRVPKTGMRFGPRVNNFGDLLGPIIVQDYSRGLSRRVGMSSDQKLFTVGSVLHFASPGDVVWGSGVNGKVSSEQHSMNGSLDVRALRGPLTRDRLWEMGVHVPESIPFGDPGLLIPQILGISRSESSFRGVGVVPNLHDRERYRRHPGFIDPLSPVRDVVTEIAGSEIIVSSSLHGLIIADALGIPSWPLTPELEPLFKYLDYYAGTNQEALPFVDDVRAAAVNAVSRERHSTGLHREWSSRALMDSFPVDLWGTR